MCLPIKYAKRTLLTIFNTAVRSFLFFSVPPGLGCAWCCAGFDAQARAWVLMSGFTLAFGAMFSKTWRVHAIFTNIKLNKKVRPTQLLFIALARLLCPQIFIDLWETLYSSTYGGSFKCTKWPVFNEMSRVYCSWSSYLELRDYSRVATKKASGL